MAYYSRKNEFEADDYACKYSDPNDLKLSLIKLYRDNASTLTPDPLHSKFYDSHPPALERINTINSCNNSLNSKLSRMCFFWITNDLRTPVL